MRPRDLPPPMRKGEPFTKYLERVTAIRRPGNGPGPGPSSETKEAEKTMIDVTTDTSGLEALIKRLEGSDGDLAKAAEAMAETILEDADQRVPKDTGALKKSGRTQ